MFAIAIVIPVLSLFLQELPFSSAQFEAPFLPPPLPMDIYPVENSGNGDLSCPLTVNMEALHNARMGTIAKYSALKEASSFEEYESGMRSLWDSVDEGIRVVVPAAGVYTGIASVIEYIALVVGVANDGFAHYYNSVPSNFQAFPNNSSYSFQVAQKAKFYCNSPPSNDNAGDCQSDEMDSLSLHHISFKPCTTLIKQYVVAYDHMQSYMATKGARAATVCSRHNQYCTGENSQFENFMECMHYMESIPFTTCGAIVFQGDSMLCRFKHSFMVRFRPEKHCPHIGRESLPCDDDDCLGDFGACEADPGDLSYTPRLHPRCCKSSKKVGKARKFRKANEADVNTSRCVNS